MSLSLLIVSVALAGDPPKEFPPPPAKATVVKVYDGDTVTLDTGDKVRLRWVNTPELKPAEEYGIEARDAARAFVLNKEVQLTFDPVSPRDGYGRIVAGLQTADGDLSVHLAERGLAHVFIIPPDETDLTKLLAAQKAAKADKLGIWSLDRYAGELHITSFHANGKGDDDSFPNGEYLRVCNVGDGPVDLSKYKLTNRAGTEFALPAVELPPGHTVKIHSGKGTPQTNPLDQITAYLGAERGVWDNEKDEVTLLTTDGKVVDRREHEVKSR